MPPIEIELFYGGLKKQYAQLEFKALLKFSNGVYVDTHGLTPVALDSLNIYFSLGIHPCAHAHGLLLFLINLLLKNTDGYNELTEVVLC